MNLQLKINENTILHYIEDSQSHYDDQNNLIIDSYQLSFSFYDCHYFLGVSRKEINEDDSSCLAIEGDSKLFDSFENLCENDLWPIIKEKCNDFDTWHKKVCESFED